MNIFVFIIIILIILKSYTKENFNIYNSDKWKNYRLGDVLKGFIKKDDNFGYINYIKRKFKNSLAYLFIKKTGGERNNKVMYDIIKTNSKSIKNIGAAIHLRLGDVVVDGNKPELLPSIYKGKKKYNYPLSNYIKIARTLKTVYFVDKVHIFGGCHKRKNIEESIKFINNIRNIFKFYGINTILHLGNNPDDDFVKMCNSKIFIKAGGGYSRLIANYVFHKKNIVIDPNDY